MSQPEAEGAALVLQQHIDKSLAKIATFQPRNAEQRTFVVSHAVQEQCRNVLRRVLQDPETVFPFIAADGEGGIAVVWHAGGYSLHINVGDDNEVTVAASSPSIAIIVATLEEFGLERLQTLIHELSEYVKAHNPHWRQLLA